MGIRTSTNCSIKYTNKVDTIDKTVDCFIMYFTNKKVIRKNRICEENKLYKLKYVFIMIKKIEIIEYKIKHQNFELKFVKLIRK
ncbi:hypothetical protein BGU61_14325 [Clostridioides difficile]|nr:hypothetical protein BGU61_14325 [Clostridioides difficile]